MRSSPASGPCCAASSGRASSPPSSRRCSTVGDLTVDRGSRRVTARGSEVHLTPLEFDLLLALAAEPGAVRGRDELMREVWGWADAGGTRTLDSHVKSLRAKIGADRVRTVHGVGYALEAGPSRDARRRRRHRRTVNADRPLDGIRSIKVKLGLLVAASIVVASLVSVIGDRGRRARLVQPARDRRRGARRSPSGWPAG